MGQADTPSGGENEHLGSVMIGRPGAEDVALSVRNGDRGPDPDGLDGAEDRLVGRTGGARGRGRAGRRQPWSGGGGRWFVWVLRAVVWVVLLVIGYRGVTAIVLNETPAGRSTAPAAPARSARSGFPTTLAEAYALQFGDVYLNFSSNSSGQRATRLAAFLPSALDSTDPQLGWNGSGSLTLQSEQVAGIRVSGAHRAVVTLLADVNGHLMELGVPVYAAGGDLAVSGQPAWLAAPGAASPPTAPNQTVDLAAQSALSSQLPAFFQAYASGNTTTMSRFLAPGASVSGLDGTVSFVSVANLDVPPGRATRHITAAVVWQLAGQPAATAPKVTTTYDMTVVDTGGKWYVQAINASTDGTSEGGSS